MVKESIKQFNALCVDNRLLVECIVFLNIPEKLVLKVRPKLISNIVKVKGSPSLKELRTLSMIKPPQEIQLKLCDITLVEKHRMKATRKELTHLVPKDYKGYVSLVRIKLKTSEFRLIMLENDAIKFKKYLLNALKECPEIK